MEYSVVKVNRDNYHMFDDMVFFRINQRERTEQERAGIQEFDTVYQVLDNPNLFVFAAQLGNQFVGWISIVYIPKISRANGTGHLFIDELWVSPAFRRQGIANALMEKADALSRDMNTSGVRLYVNTDNDTGISLYEASGFERQYGTALFMEKEWDRKESLV